jgi:hypothetical protein
MTLPPTKANSRPAQVIALDYEIAQEQASALGRLGRAIEGALSALASHDGASVPARRASPPLSDEAQRTTRRG